jgi:hypothetical protein
MLKSKNWTFQAMLLMALAWIESASCAETSSLRKPPILTPVSLERKGIVAEFDFEVAKHWIYEFEIRFKFPEKDQNERSRIRKIIGGHELDKNNSPINPGVPTPVRLTIFKEEAHSKLPVYRKTITPTLSSWGADNFTKNIGHCDLVPGKYSALLESLTPHEEYASVPSFFLIGADTFKVSFDPKKIDRNKTCPQ